MENDNDTAEKKIYESWKTCHENQLIITTLEHVTVSIDNLQVHIDGVFKHNITAKTTIFLTNCRYVTLTITSKIARLIIEKSNNINITLFGRVISGVDILHSRVIKLTICENRVYYIGIGHVYNLTVFISESLANDTIISTLQSNTILFYVGNFKYITNMSIFDSFNLFVFSQTLELNFINNISSGTIPRKPI